MANEPERLPVDPLEVPDPLRRELAIDNILTAIKLGQFDGARQWQLGYAIAKVLTAREDGR